MFLVKRKDFEWSHAGYDGGFRSILRTSKEGGKTSIVKLKKDAVAPTHYHASGEDVLVLSGSVKIGDYILGVGDYLYTEKGESHNLIALEDATIFISSEKPVFFDNKN